MGPQNEDKGVAGRVGAAGLLLKHVSHSESDRNKGIRCGDARMTFRPFKGERELGGVVVATMLVQLVQAGKKFADWRAWSSGVRGCRLGSPWLLLWSLWFL